MEALGADASRWVIMSDINAADIGEVIVSLSRQVESDLFSLTQEQLQNQWLWRWDERGGIEWNLYKFSDMLEMHKRRCRRWEEHHNGNECVVERVRDRYLMPRIREFRQILAAKMAEQATPATLPESNESGCPGDLAG